MCDEKSLGLLPRRKETEVARREGEEGCTREQLREDEHEYIGLVLRARGRRTRGEDPRERER